MRRILIERARRGRRLRHGGGRRRLDLDKLDSAQLQVDPADEGPVDELLALDEALTRLEADDPEAAAVVKLRYFAGLTIEDTAAALAISVSTANRHWAYAKACLYQQLCDSRDADPG
jgi:RNA polymerase sigma factor (TIGR02999 family)